MSCFPLEYNTYNFYIKSYHDTIAARIREIASESEQPLEKNELVQLLGWIHAYAGETMLGTRALGVNAAALVGENPLLPKSLTAQLHDRFIELTRRDMQEWLDKTLTQEKDVRSS